MAGGKGGRSPGTLHALLAWLAELDARAPVLLAPGRPPLTAGQLQDRVEALGHALRSHDVDGESRVAVALPAGPEMAVAVLGTAAAARCAPLNPGLRVAELDAYLARLGASAVVAAAGHETPVRAVARARGLPVIEAGIRPDRPAGWLEVGGRAAPPARGMAEPAPGDAALVLPTSGTTGEPKLVSLSHANLCASARSIAASLALTPADRCLDIMPLFHIHGLMVLLASLAAGGSAACPPAFDPAAFPAWVEELRPTWYSAVPTMHQAILREVDLDGREPAPLRFIRSSSAPLPATVAARLEAAFGVPVIEAYGMTEASHQIATNPLPPGERRAGSVGLPSGAEIAIVDEAGRPLPAGATGEVAIRGPGVIGAEGISPPTSLLPGGWLRTGDLGRCDGDGYLYLTGRLKEVINRGGEKVAPREVEAVLLEHPALAAAAVFAVTHPTLGEDVAAAVVARPGADVVVPAVRAFVAARLAEFKVPRTVLVVDALPAGPTGKVDRRALAAEAGRRRLAETEAPRDADLDGPRAALATTIARIGAELLGLEGLGPDESFLERGGDSLSAARLAARLADALGVSVPASAILLDPTPRALAGSLLAGPGESRAPAPVARRWPGPDRPVSPGQAALWFLHELDPRGSAYNRAVALHLEGPLEIAVLRAALAEIAHRHEILRTTFPAVDGRPVQRVGPAGAPELPVDDLAALAEGERHPELRRRARGEVRRPFDLAGGPVWRARLLRLAPDDHVLVLTIHHVAFDGWSEGLLVRELATLYEALAAGRPSPLAEPALQYGDAAAWQETRLREDALAADLAYWQTQLGGERARLDLPVEAPGAAEADGPGTRETVEIPGPLATALRHLGRGERATLFMTLLAGLHALLHRYTGQTDILVGTVVAGRDAPPVESLIGLFANTVLVRADIAGDPTFRALLRQVRERTLEAYRHQALPYARLVEALHPARAGRRDPLCQVVLTMDLPAPPALRAGALTVHRADAGAPVAQFDLTIRVEPQEAALLVHAEYPEGLFAPGTASRLLGHLQTLLEAAAADPDRPVGRLPLLRPAERRQVLVDWNRTARPYALDQGLHELVAAQARRTPDAVAVELGERHLTYRELDDHASGLAGQLLALGVRPGARVGVALERAPELVVAFLAVLKAGAAYTPLDPDAPRERLAYLAGDAGVAALVTRADLRAVLPPFAGPVVWLEPGAPAAAPDPAAPALPRVDPDSVAYVIYTSGSTGRPKGTLNTHRGIVNQVLWTQEAFPLTAADRVVQKTPIGFDVSVWEIAWPLTAGARLVLARPGGHLDPDYLVTLVRQAGITVLHFVPSMLPPFLEHPGLGACRSLRQIFCSGETLPYPTTRRLLTRLPGVGLANLYGPAETAVHVTAWRCRPDEPRGSVPIGRPVANTRVYVLDARGEPVPIGIPGEVHLGGVQVGPGYLGRAELTAERFVPDPFVPDPEARLYRTGDRARFRPDGVLEYLGRLDFQVKIRGVRIEPGEIEAALGAHPAVRETVVVARPGDGGVPRLVAYVVPRGPAPAAAALRQFLRRTLPEPMIPEAFVPLDRLPVGPTGKVDRGALPDPGSPGSGDRDVDRAEPAVAPRTPVEAALARTWAEVLGREVAGVHDDFFALGGHSLLAARLLARIQDVFGVELSLRQFFATPTVAGLAGILAVPRPAPPAPGPRPARAPRWRDGALPLSSAQLRFWLLDQLHPGHHALNVPSAFRVRGALDVPALARSLQAVVDRHEALRTTLPVVDGAPRQMIREALAVDLPVVDLDPVPESGRAARALEACTAWARRGFDLARGPLLDARLLRLAPDDHVFFLNLHHCVADAGSLAIAQHDLAAAYAACRAGLAPTLAPLPAQYADYARWEEEHLRSAEVARHVEAWRRTLAPPLPRLDLAGHRRPRAPGFRGRQVERLLDGDVASGLRRIGQAEGATLFMVLLAAFQALLREETGLDDPVVGAPVSTRPGMAFEGVVGCFLNTVILRGSLAGNPTCRELVRRARDVALDAHARADVPIERLVHELRLERPAGGAPLVEALLNMHEFDDRALPLAGLEVTPLPHVGESALTDVTLYFTTVAGGIAFTLNYDADRLDAPRTTALLDRYLVLLRAVAADPEQRLAALAHTRASRRLPPAAGPAPVGPAPAGSVPWTGTERSIPARFEAVAHAHPARAAVRAGGTTWSYEALARASRAITQLLLAEVGVGEARVGLLLGHDAPMVAAVLGTLGAGKAYVPLDPGYPRARLGAMLADSRATLLLADAPHAGLARELAGGALPVLEAETAGRGGGERPLGDVEPGRLAYLLYTSGSTGTPKGVMQDHRNVLHFIRVYARHLGLGPDDRLSLLASYGFDAAVMDVFGALLTGGTLCLWDVRRDGLGGMAEWLAGEGVTVYHSTPTLFRHFLAEVPGDRIFHAVRLVVMGGEELFRSDVELFRRHFPPASRLVNGLGPTESTLALQYVVDRDTRLDGHRVPVGFPVEGTEILLLDEQGLPNPVTGEIAIRSRHVALGYWGQPELTRAAFLPDPDGGDRRLYRTGDLGHRLPDGALEYRGRKDQQLKVRGHRVEPGEIEAALLRHPAVREAAVVGREAGPGDLRLVGYLVPSGATPPDTGEIRRFVGTLLPDHMVPSGLVLLEALPLTPTGKIDRRRLPEPATPPPVAAPAPETPVERAVARLWEELLGTSPRTTEEGFFEAGGDSLLAARLVLRIQQTLGVQVPLRHFLETPTVAGLATAVLEGLMAAAPSEGAAGS